MPKTHQNLSKNPKHLEGSSEAENRVLCKLFDTTLPFPERKTAGAAGFDLCARLTVTIAPHSVGYVPLNIALQLPQGHWALLAARSSLHKKGLLLANGIGVGDGDFCGDADEYVAPLLNFTATEVRVEKGERIAQLLIMRDSQPVLERVTTLTSANRGAFGTTGAF